MKYRLVSKNLTNNVNIYYKYVFIGCLFLFAVWLYYLFKDNKKVIVMNTNNNENKNKCIM